jgi:uncharacterized membrane protein YraQ (UPF0718 family)
MKKNTTAKETIRDLILLGITLSIAIILLSIFPDRRDIVFTTSWKFFVEMIWILPAVMILMGLFMVWVPKEMVVKYVGKTSGIKGIFLALLFGSLPTGPLYVAFPIAAALIKKGARISNVIIFLNAWACIKLPQEMVELQFLGPKFMALRLILTIIFTVVMAMSIERLIEWSNNKNSVSYTAHR